MKRNNISAICLIALLYSCSAVSLSVDDEIKKSDEYKDYGLKEGDTLVLSGLDEDEMKDNVHLVRLSYFTENDGASEEVSMDNTGSVIAAYSTSKIVNGYEDWYKNYILRDFAENHPNNGTQTDSYSGFADWTYGYGKFDLHEFTSVPAGYTDIKYDHFYAEKTLRNTANNNGNANYNTANPYHSYTYREHFTTSPKSGEVSCNWYEFKYTHYIYNNWNNNFQNFAWVPRDEYSSGFNCRAGHAYALSQVGSYNEDDKEINLSVTQTHNYQDYSESEGKFYIDVFENANPTLYGNHYEVLFGKVIRYEVSFDEMVRSSYVDPPTKKSVIGHSGDTYTIDLSQAKIVN